MERQTANIRENEKHKNRIMTIKSSIKSSGCKPQYLQALYNLVDNVNVLVTHTYALSKYIFLQELDLLRHTNQNCLKTNGEKSKLWNGDLAVVLNFNHILCSLRETGERPSHFSRGIKTGTTTASRKRRVSDSSPLPPSSSTAEHFKSS